MKVWIGERVYEYEGSDVVVLHVDQDAAKAACDAHEAAETEQDDEHYTVVWAEEESDGKFARHRGRLDDDTGGRCDISYIVYPFELAGLVERIEGEAWAWLNRHDAPWSPSDAKVSNLAYAVTGENG